MVGKQQKRQATLTTLYTEQAFRAINLMLIKTAHS